MIDHIGFPLSDFARSNAFYTAALAPLHCHVLHEVGKETSGTGDFAEFGQAVAQFWIGTGTPLKGSQPRITRPVP